jgi:hypothetical protein
MLLKVDGWTQGQAQAQGLSRTSTRRVDIASSFLPHSTKDVATSAMRWEFLLSS